MSTSLLSNNHLLTAGASTTRPLCHTLLIKPTTVVPATSAPTPLKHSIAHTVAARPILLCRSRSSTDAGDVRDQANVDVGYSDQMPKRKNLAVFVSGGGSNFRAIHAATLNGSILGDVVALVTNKTGCGGAAYARDNGIPVLLYPKAKEESEGFSPNDLVDKLRKFQVDFIILAGYLKIIPVELVQAFPKRIVNIHPSLLPAFGGKGYYGLKVHKAVIASGARYSGPTVHFVDEEYDTGRILAQRVVPICAFDTPEELAARVLHQEHRLYVDVVAALCEERIMWRDDGVPLIQSRHDRNQYS